ARGPQSPVLSGSRVMRGKTMSGTRRALGPSLLSLATGWLLACSGTVGGGGSPATDAGVSDGVDSGVSQSADAGTEDSPDAGPPVDSGVEPPDGTAILRRMELAGLLCTLKELDSGAGCPQDDPKCLCVPEFNSINRAKGSAGNPHGKVIILSQPQFGKR